MIRKNLYLFHDISVAKLVWRDSVRKVLWNFRSSDDRAFDRQSKSPGLDTQRSRNVTLFTEKKNYSNIYSNFHLVLNDINSKSQVDKVDMVEFGYHGEWYTLLIFYILDWNDLVKFGYSSGYIRGQNGVNRFCAKSLGNHRGSGDRAFDRHSKGPGLDT